MQELTVIHTQDRHGQPLAVVRDLPGLDADLTPEQLRSLAFALLGAANDCERLNKLKRRSDSTVMYGWGGT